MGQSILLVSPLTEHISAVCVTLKRFGLDVSQIKSVDDTKAGLASHSPAFLILDIDIKGSEQILSEISYNSVYCHRPFIMVATTLHQSTKRAALLRLGADICIGKPVDAEEVLAVICAVQRRERWAALLGRSRHLPRVDYKDLTIDPFKRCVTMRGMSVTLTAKEFDILCLLAQHKGTVLTKEEIYKTVWDEGFNPNAGIIADHISSIRKKLGLTGKNNEYIQTVFGIGYRFGKLGTE